MEKDKGFFGLMENFARATVYPEQLRNSYEALLVNTATMLAERFKEKAGIVFSELLYWGKDIERFTEEMKVYGIELNDMDTRILGLIIKSDNLQTEAKKHLLLARAVHDNQEGHFAQLLSEPI